MKKKLGRNYGFTLVELLIVITIIAILSAIGYATYSIFSKNARDAKRRSDLNFIQTALEHYFADQHFYPEAGGLGNCPETEDGLLRFDCPLMSTDGSKNYLSTVPKEMGSNLQYSYVPSPNNCSNQDQDTICKTYCLFAKMENTGNGKEDPKCRLSGEYNFSLTKP